MRCAEKILSIVLRLHQNISRVIGGTPPENLIYELFLDENGQKISKSKGNGIAVEDWLKYGPPESLSLFMFQQPKRAKRLYFDVIPKNTDEYISFRSKVLLEEKDRKLENPTWHIHNGEIPQDKIPLNFSLLLNLASVCHAEDTAYGDIFRSYTNDTSPENNMFLDKLANYAVNFYRDFVKPTKTYRFPDSQEAKALEDLKRLTLKQNKQQFQSRDIQTVIYEIGKSNEFEKLEKLVPSALSNSFRSGSRSSFWIFRGVIWHTRNR